MIFKGNKRIIPSIGFAIIAALSANADAASLNVNELIAGRMTPLKLTDGGTDVTHLYQLSSSDVTIALVGGRPYAMGKEAGAKQITASLKDNLSQSESFSVEVKPGQVSRLIVLSGDKQITLLNSDLLQPLKVKAIDKYNNGVQGVTVTFTPSLGGVVTPSQAVTGSDGTAETMYKASSRVGAERVIAQAAGVISSGRAMFTAGVLKSDPLAAAKLAFTIPNNRVDYKDSFSLSVRILDGKGSLVTAARNVTLSAHKNSSCTSPASALSGTTTALSSNGVASFSNLTYPSNGYIHIKAESEGLSACSPKIALTGGMGLSSIQLSAPSSSLVARKFTVSGILANAVGSTFMPSVPVSIAAYSDSACNSLYPSLDGTTLVNSRFGRFTFAGLSYANAGKIYLKASAGNVHSACSEMEIQAPPSIVGAWTLTEGTAVTTLEFKQDKTFKLTQTGVADASGQPGDEEGLFTWNPTTGLFMFKITKDENGDWGISSTVGSVLKLVLSQDRQKLKLFIDGVEEAEFSKQQSGSAVSSVSGRYFEIALDVTDMGTGGSLVLTEIQVIQNGVAKTLADMGASVISHNFAMAVNPISNGSYVSDSAGNNYTYGTPSSLYLIVDLGSVKSIEGFALGFGGFSGMERTPSTVRLYASETQSAHGALELKKTYSTPRSEYTKDSRKDFMFTPAAPGPTVSGFIWDQKVHSYTVNGTEGGIASSDENNGGLTFTKSSSGLVGDFEIVYEASQNQMGNFWFIGLDDDTSMAPGTTAGLMGFNNHDNDCRIYANDGFQTATPTIASILSGIADKNQAIPFKLKRVGNDISYFVNGTKVATLVYASAPTLYPTIRLNGAISKAYKAGENGGGGSGGSVMASGRYFEIEMDVTDMSTGGSVVLTELQVIQNGVAKTLEQAGATVIAHNFSMPVHPISNGSFASDASGNNYTYGTGSSLFLIVDLGSVKSIEGFALGFGGFSGMERTPSTVRLYASETQSAHGALELKKTYSTPRSEYTQDSRKDFMFAPAAPGPVSVGNFVTWEHLGNGYSVGAEGYISHPTPDGSLGNFSKATPALSGDFDLRFESLKQDVGGYYFVGVHTSTHPNVGITDLAGFDYHEGTFYVFSNGSFDSSTTPDDVFKGHLSSTKLIFRIQRVGSELKFYINESLVSTRSFTGATVYPCFRSAGTVLKTYIMP